MQARKFDCSKEFIGKSYNVDSLTVGITEDSTISRMTILVISAKVDLSDRILGLDLGADDYIVKPFEPLEVVAKVKARLRRLDAGRSSKASGMVLSGDLCLNTGGCCLVRNGTEILLSKTEYLILKMFMKNPGRVFSGAVAVAAGTLIVNIIMGAALIMVGPAAWLFSRMVTKKINAEIQRQTDERNMLYANIAHDLKTPMTSIVGYAKALGDKKVELEQSEIVIDRIYQKAKQTDELLNMLFEYTKLQAESYPLNKMETDICRVVRSVAAGQYEALRKAEDRVFIIVADTGMDIGKEESEIIFEPFVSGDVSRNAACGSGLGLAIAKKIVERHGGTLTVEHKERCYVKEFVICLWVV